MSGSKGMSFTLEAVIAGLIIVTALLFFFRASGPDEIYTMGMSERGYNCLKYVDDSGILRGNATSDNYTNIETGLQDCLAGLNYTVQICRYVCTSASIEENVTVVVSDYFIAGDVEPDPLYVKLSMWL